MRNLRNEDVCNQVGFICTNNNRVRMIFVGKMVGIHCVMVLLDISQPKRIQHIFTRYVTSLYWVYSHYQQKGHLVGQVYSKIMSKTV